MQDNTPCRNKPMPQPTQNKERSAIYFAQKGYRKIHQAAGKGALLLRIRRTQGGNKTMGIEIISQELDIKACSAADLTAKQLQAFTKEWPRETVIAEMTLFTDPETGTVILNRDHKDFETVKQIAIKYFGIQRDKRGPFARSLPTAYTRTWLILRDATLDREIWKAKQSNAPGRFEQALLFRLDPKLSPLTFTAYACGVMAGKRQERARRRKNAWNE